MGSQICFPEVSTLSFPEKRDIADSFSKAASTYDQAAHFQQSVAARLRADNPFTLTAPAETLLDMGCGTGNELPELMRCFSPERTLVLDLAPGMIQYAKAQNYPAMDFIVGDIECLPFAANQFDVVHSSLAIQWCVQLEQVFNEVHRCLKPGGVGVISTLLTGTLHELENAWREVDGWQHVNAFFSRSEVEGILNASEFGLGQKSTYQLNHEQVVLTYDSVRQLTQELKALGAHNLNANRPRSMTGKAGLMKFLDAYEQFRLPSGKLPATYEVLYVYLKKEQ